MRAVDQVTGHSESSSGGIRSWRLRRAVEPGLLLILAISVAGTAAALSLDVVGALGSVKGDEATYVMMALSAAHDGDLVYESTDLSRFYRLYEGGPEGLFLKREAGPGAVVVTVFPDNSLKYLADDFWDQHDERLADPFA